MEIFMTVDPCSATPPQWLTGKERTQMSDEDQSYLILKIFVRKSPNADLELFGEVAIIGRNVVAANTGFNPIYLEALLASDDPKKRIPFATVGRTRIFFEPEVRRWLQAHGHGGRGMPQPIFYSGLPFRALNEAEKKRLMPSDDEGGIVSDTGETVLWTSSKVIQAARKEERAIIQADKAQTVEGRRRSGARKISAKRRAKPQRQRGGAQR